VSTPDPAEPPVHDGQIVIGDILTPDGPADLKPLSVKFVHYPGSQQLIVWLPKPAYQGYAELSVVRDGADIERGPVTSRMNGSVQILFRTLEWPPGAYAITITHEEGWRHTVGLVKYAPGAEPKPPLPPPPEPVVDKPPIIYRDGFGNVIPNTYLEMRAVALSDIARKFKRRIEYEGNYRAGTIHYVDGDRRISFWHEMAGGNMKFYIDIPTEEQWEARTGTPLSERADIIDFVAARVKQDQAPNWRYEITANSIDFY
jgi:hypothetical protein